MASLNFFYSFHLFLIKFSVALIFHNEGRLMGTLDGQFPFILHIIYSCFLYYFHVFLFLELMNVYFSNDHTLSSRHHCWVHGAQLLVVGGSVYLCDYDAFIL